MYKLKKVWENVVFFLKKTLNVKMTKDEIISRVIKNEYEITMAVLGGHKPYEGDKYHSKRIENKELRELLKTL